MPLEFTFGVFDIFHCTTSLCLPTNGCGLARTTFHTSSNINLSSESTLPCIQVTATDGDKDRPQNIVYFLTGQGIDPDNPANSKFDINRTTGEIFVLKVRKRVVGKKSFRIFIHAATATVHSVAN